MPCSPGDPEGIEMRWSDIEDASTLKEPPVEMNDMLRALRHTKPTVNQKDLTRIDEFTKEFGQDA